MRKRTTLLLLGFCILYACPIDTALGGTCTAYLQIGGTAVETGQNYCGTVTDESAVQVTNSGTLTLSDSTITGSGNTSSSDNSSFYGLNAGVLATSSSAIGLSNSTVSTTGTGANGVFATGTGSSINLSNVTINCIGQWGHGVDATQGGVLTLSNVDITTAGTNAASIATDRGSGTISVKGGTMTTSGVDSPGIYSTGSITVSGAAIKATGSEGAVIEGENSVTLTDTTLSGAKKWGVLIYQSMSGDAAGVQGTFEMTGGSLSAAVGPLFYVTNSTGVITLKGVTVAASSGTLVNATAGNWGVSGSNGGRAIFNADGETLTGDVTSDSISSITATLQNGTTLTGYINSAALTLDSTSSWHVTGDSYLTSLTDAGETSGSTISNIYGNGFTVFYDVSLAANSWLGGGTYTLNGGGYLTPGSLAANLGSAGLWQYRNGAWSKLSGSSPNLMASYGSKLVANFLGFGLWQYDGTNWSQLTGLSGVENLLGVSGKLYADYGTAGLWKYDGVWTQITQLNPAKIAPNGSNLLAAFSGYGLFQYDGTTWTQLISTTISVGDLLAISGKVYVTFGGLGLWKYDDGWSRLTPINPDRMQAYNGKLVANFPDYGLYLYDGTNWTQLTTLSTPEGLIAVLGNLYVDYGTLGLYRYNGTWTQITFGDANHLGSYGEKLVANFPGYGLYEFDGSSWNMMTGYSGAIDLIGVALP